jgi:uncharacterized protein involved in exopolysaccharide biosynthesis
MDACTVTEDSKVALPLSARTETPVQALRSPFPSGSREPEIDLPTIIAILRRRKSVLVGTVLVVSALTWVILLQITPLYTASTALMLNTRQAQVVSIKAVMSDLPIDEASVRSELDVLQSRGLAGRVVDKLGLVEDPEFNGELRAPGWIAKLQSSEWLPWRRMLG